MGKDKRTGVKAVESAGRILEVLARAQKPVALRELAAGGHMSPGKVHRYLASFLTSGLARQDPDTRRYSRPARHAARTCGTKVPSTTP